MAMLIAALLAASLAGWVMTVAFRHRRIDDRAMAVAAADLPQPYDAMALREMRATRAAGIEITQAKTDAIVALFARMTAEHAYTGARP